MPNPIFSAADAAHRAPYTSLSFATKQDTAINVDAANLTISNVVLCAVGEAEGHGVSIDAKFVADMVADIAANMKKGVKSNLRHNYENAGFQLGRIKNVKIDGDRVVGDLTCYASADKSPLAPGMATWLIELVSEDAEAMMMSINCNIAHYYQRDEFGNEVKVWEYNAEDRWISPNYDMPIYVAYGKLKSCDAVAEGALTNAMFSKSTHNNESDVFTRLINTIKRAFNLGKNDPEDDDTDFFPHTPPSVAAAAQSKITVPNMENTTPPVVVEPTVEFAAAQAKVTALTADNATLTASVAERDTKIVTLEADKKAVADKLTVAEAKITELSALAAAAHTGGKTDTKVVASGFGSEHDKLKAQMGF